MTRLIKPVYNCDDDDNEEKMSFHDKFLKTRTLLISEAVTSKAANKFISNLLMLEAEDPEKTVTVLINSPGGEIYSGLAMYDMMSFVTCPIQTIVVGLAASMGIIASIAFGTMFFLTGINYQQSILAFSLAGALFGFLKFNITPAKIFMGDTGSMVVGFIISFLSIEFLELNNTKESIIFSRFSIPLIAMSFMFLPLYDLVRVFCIRLLNNRSPFKADQNHLHHMLLKLGLSHTFSTFVLSLFHIRIYAVFRKNLIVKFFESDKVLIPYSNDFTVMNQLEISIRVIFTPPC